MGVVYVIGTPALFFVLLGTKKAIVSPHTENLANSILERRDSYRDNESVRRRTSSIRTNSSAVWDDDNQEAVFLAKQAESYAYYAKIVKYGPAVGKELIEVTITPLFSGKDRVEAGVRRLGDDLTCARNRLDREIGHLSFLFADYGTSPAATCDTPRRSELLVVRVV